MNDETPEQPFVKMNDETPEHQIVERSPMQMVQKESFLSCQPFVKMNDETPEHQLVERTPMQMVQKVSFLCCQFCPYKTKFTGNLAKHIRTHTGERPFECPFCLKRFASKSNYNTHVVIHSPSGTPSLKLSSAERLSDKRGRFRCASLHRQYPVDVNPDIVRSMPMVKTLISSSRSSQRSSVQQLSPIGSFLLPDRTNSGFSHTALYSSINYTSVGSASLSIRNENSLLSTEMDEPNDLHSGDNDSMEEAANIMDGVPVLSSYSGGDHMMAGNEGDVKPRISDIFSMLQNSSKQSHVRREHASQSQVAIKEEANDDCSEAVVVKSVSVVRSGRRKKRTAQHFMPPFESTAKVFNGTSSCKSEMNIGIPVSPMRSDEDQSQVHTQMLIDTLIKESRLFRCEACNILFPEYSVYVLHMGCHGNESAYQCHFCNQFFEDKFGFLTHFVRCPHEQSCCQ